MNVLVDGGEEERKVVGRGKGDELIGQRGASVDAPTSSPALVKQCRYLVLLSLTAARSLGQLSLANRANSPVPIGIQLFDPSKHVQGSKACVYPYSLACYCLEASIQLLDHLVVHTTSPDDLLLQIFIPEDAFVLSPWAELHADHAYSRSRLVPPSLLPRLPW